jgi:hypothetical protein
MRTSKVKETKVIVRIKVKQKENKTSGALNQVIGTHD